MSLKLEATKESSSVKGTKTKKRASKARKSTRNSVKRRESTANKLFENKDTNTSNINTEDFGENHSNGNYAVAPYSGRISVNGSMSEIVVGERDRLSKSNSCMKLDSYCRYQCSCKVLNKCREKLDLKLVTRNDTPIRMMYKQQAGEKLSARNYNINRKTPSQFSITRKSSVYDNLNSLKSNQGTNQKSYKTNKNPPLNTERRNSNNSSNSRNSFYNAKRNSATHQNVPCRSKCCDCFNFEPFRICKHIQFCNCNCNVPCEEITSGSLKTPRNSFSSSQSCPQLDVIKEEDIESEELHSKCSSIEMPKRSDPRSKFLTKEKIQKTLEDSCADFLSIICDNILESVQKSVDTKVIEINSESKEKLEELSKKLDENEIMLKSCCQEMMKKMTEQNNSYFQKMYSLIQTSLMETKGTNQYPETKKSYQDNQSQYENVVKEDEENGNNVITEKFEDKINDENNGREKLKGCGCCQCVIDDGNTSQKLQSNKSYPNNKLKENMSPPPPVLEENQFSVNVPLNEMDTGNLMADLSNVAEVIKESFQELKTPEIASPKSSKIEIHENIDLNTKFPLLNDNSNHNFRKVSEEEDLKNIQSFPVKNIDSLLKQTPSDETHSQSIESILEKSILSPPVDNISKSYITNPSTKSNNSINSKNSEPPKNFPNTEDNNDTSGYTTEPEDNNDVDSANSGRKKFQKRASKPPFTSAPVTLRVVKKTVKKIPHEHNNHV
ncbi:uncharacterized protein ACRADG_000354 [Cochliomyia hominivorax]